MRPCPVISAIHDLLVYTGVLCFSQAHLRHLCPFLCLHPPLLPLPGLEPIFHMSFLIPSARIMRLSLIITIKTTPAGEFGSEHP